MGGQLCFQPPIFPSYWCQMRYRPSRSFLLGLVAFAIVGAISFWIWNRLGSVPAHQLRSMGFFKSFFNLNEGDDRSFPTEKDRARNRAATEALIQKIGDEYPTLKIVHHPVPDAENGFLQFYRFSQEHDSIKSPTLLELQRFLGENRWNPEEAKRLLSQNAQSVDRIEAIAALSQRSTANMPSDYTGFIGARSMKFAADVLMVKARLAAEAHDEPEALRLTKAALNLCTHLRQVEAPNLLGETVVILLDLSIANVTFQHLLPALGRDANLPEWKAALSLRSYRPADFAQVMRGEWDNTMRYYLFPVLVDRSSRNRPKDADEFARVISFHYCAFINRLYGMSLAEMRKDPGIAVPGDLEKMSAKSREIYNILMIGSRAWSKGYQRASVKMAQYQAAFDLLILEKEGAKLTPESTEKVNGDPIAGKPFGFDPATRTLKTTTSDITPLKLPF
jgi:hypothetical protein